MTINVGHSLRTAWWRRFHPFVRIGWYVASAGSSRPAAQTYIGVGMMAAGIALRRSHNERNRLIYTQIVNPGHATRIRVYRGTSPPSEVVVRT